MPSSSRIPSASHGFLSWRRAASLLAVVAVSALALIAPPAAAVDPMCPARVFRDPICAGDFVQYDSLSPAPQYLTGIQELEDMYGDVIDVRPIGKLVGMPGARSAGGRKIPVITVTDESVPNRDKVDLYISMSIHGLERAGLEGGVRFIEDIARGWYAEQEGGSKFFLANGDPERDYYRKMTATGVLKKARLVFVDLNPDGWDAGDRDVPTDGKASFVRGNDHAYEGGELLGPFCCVDLNRQWPTLGYARSSGIQYKTLAEPEAKAGYKLIEEHLGVPEGAADLHGENEDNVLLAIMFPGGQFDPRGLAQQVELAESIKYNVNHSVFPGAAGLLSETNEEVYPAEYHTAYDAIGYDDAGFQGDYLVQRGILEMDHEYILSNIAPGSVFIPALEQVHVDTTRELLKATIVTTIQSDKIVYEADLGGPAGYVLNTKVLRHTDEGIPDPPFGFEQKPYASTSMQYYRDLAKYTTSPLTPVRKGAVAAGAGLKGLETVVVTNRHPDNAGFWQSLRRFARRGGNVVLTDAALQGVEDLGIVGKDKVTRIKQDAGKMENYDREHPLLKEVTGVIGQTYFEVSLGFPFGVKGDQSPAWFVDTEAWEGAGGTTAATAGDGTALGTVALGEGKVSIFGAVLPDASQKFPHTQGLADYAVTYAGNAILVNALQTAGADETDPGEADGPRKPDDGLLPETGEGPRNVSLPGDDDAGSGTGGADGSGEAGADESGAAGGTGGVAGAGATLPATGGGLVLLGAAALAAGAGVRVSRTRRN